MKNLFVVEGTEKIELKDGLWVEVPKTMSYEKYRESLDGDLGFLKKVLKGWNFKDHAGKDVECTPENIDKLTSSIVSPLTSILIEKYSREKKILMDSSK